MKFKNENIEVLKDYVTTRDKLSDKMLIFSDIINDDFDNGFGPFIYERMTIEEVKGIDRTLDEIALIKDKMYEYVALPSNEFKIEDMNKLAKEFINQANSVIESVDKVIKYYEEYNLQ